MRALVIGYGSIGKRHVQLLNTLEKITDVDIVTKQNIKEYPGKHFLTLQDIPNLSEYDYFVIANETYKHFDTLHSILRRVRKKKILVEKPLFCKQKELNIFDNEVFVAYNLRFHPVIEELNKILKNEKILFVNIFTGQYLPTWRPQRDYRLSYSASLEQGGGVLLDLSHEIDYINFLFSHIVSLKSFNKKISNLEISSDDIFTAIGETENGALINISLDYISKKPLRRILVHTLNKTVEADLINNHIEIFDTTSKMQSIKKKSDKNESYKKMHMAVIENRHQKLCSFEEGLEIIKLIDTIRQRETIYEN